MTVMTILIYIVSLSDRKREYIFGVLSRYLHYSNTAQELHKTDALSYNRMDFIFGCYVHFCPSYNHQTHRLIFSACFTVCE